MMLEFPKGKDIHALELDSLNQTMFILEYSFKEKYLRSLLLKICLVIKGHPQTCTTFYQMKMKG